MGKFENFKSEQELVGRIEQLRADGVSDGDITVFSKEELEGNSLNYTNVNFKSADGSAWDRFVSLFTSEAAEERAIADLGLSEENKQEYITALQAGDILLFVSEEAKGASESYLVDDTANDQSDDDAVGGEPHDAEYQQEEDDPGLPGTDRDGALSNPAAGSTAGANERDTVRDEEVNVDSRGISNKPGTNSDGSTRQDKDVSGYGTKDSGSRVKITKVEPDETFDDADEDNREDDREGTMRAGSGQAHEAKEQSDDDIIRDEDIERDARVVDEEPFHEYETEETAERVDVSTYGYDDTVNRDDIETASDGSRHLKDEDVKRDDRAIRNKHKFEEARDSEYTSHDPDRRNFNM